METRITNEIKTAIVKRNNLFEEWIQNPTKTNRERYKNARKNVTKLIRKEQRNEKFQNLENPTPKQIYKTLKLTKNQAQNTNNPPDVEILNNYFLSVGSFLSKKVQEKSSTFPIEIQPKTMLLGETNEQEIFKNLCKRKNEECML